MKQHDAGVNEAVVTRWLDEREALAWRGLMVMTAQLQAELGRQLSSAELSTPDYAVLVSLTEARDGRVRAHELADRLGWEKSRLSHQINRMSARGLVNRTDCPSDRRGTFVEVTVEGRAAIERAAPGHVDTVRQLFIDRLSRDQLEALISITSTVLDHECRMGRD